MPLDPLDPCFQKLHASVLDLKASLNRFRESFMLHQIEHPTASVSAATTEASLATHELAATVDIRTMDLFDAKFDTEQSSSSTPFLLQAEITDEDKVFEPEPSEANVSFSTPSDATSSSFLSNGFVISSPIMLVDVAFATKDSPSFESSENLGRGLIFETTSTTFNPTCDSPSVPFLGALNNDTLANQDSFTTCLTHHRQPTPFPFAFRDGALNVNTKPYDPGPFTYLFPWPRDFSNNFSQFKWFADDGFPSSSSSLFECNRSSGAWILLLAGPPPPSAQLDQKLHTEIVGIHLTGHILICSGSAPDGIVSRKYERPLFLFSRFSTAYHHNFLLPQYNFALLGKDSVTIAQWFSRPLLFLQFNCLDPTWYEYDYFHGFVLIVYSIYNVLRVTIALRIGSMRIGKVNVCFDIFNCFLDIQCAFGVCPFSVINQLVHTILYCKLFLNVLSKVLEDGFKPNYFTFPNVEAAQSLPLCVLSFLTLYCKIKEPKEFQLLSSIRWFLSLAILLYSLCVADKGFWVEGSKCHCSHTVIDNSGIPYCFAPPLANMIDMKFGIVEGLLIAVYATCTQKIGDNPSLTIPYLNGYVAPYFFISGGLIAVLWEFLSTCYGPKLIIRVALPDSFDSLSGLDASFWMLTITSSLLGSLDRQKLSFANSLRERGWINKLMCHHFGMLLLCEILARKPFDDFHSLANLPETYQVVHVNMVTIVFKLLNYFAIYVDAPANITPTPTWFTRNVKLNHLAISKLVDHFSSRKSGGYFTKLALIWSIAITIGMDLAQAARQLMVGMLSIVPIGSLPAPYKGRMVAFITLVLIIPPAQDVQLNVPFTSSIHSVLENSGGIFFPIALDPMVFHHWEPG